MTSLPLLIQHATDPALIRSNQWAAGYTVRSVRMVPSTHPAMLYRALVAV